MKIHAINNEILSGYKQYPDYDKYKHGLYESNKKTQGYNVNFGSGAGVSKATKFFANKFEKSLVFFDENTSLMQAGVALIVAGLLRPATNLAMAGKEDREDSIYAASHAISSAVIGFIVSSLALKPFDDAYKRVTKHPEKYLSDEYNALAEKFLKVFGNENEANELLTQLKNNPELMEQIKETKEGLKGMLKHNTDPDLVDVLKENAESRIKSLYESALKLDGEKLDVVAKELDRYIEIYPETLEQNVAGIKSAMKRQTEIAKRAKKILKVKKVNTRNMSMSNASKNLQKLIKMSFDTLFLGIPKALLTIALIPPILKYVFHMEKKPKGTTGVKTQGSKPSFMNVSINDFMKGNK